MSGTAIRLGALARRDARIQLSYQFHLGLRYANLLLALLMFAFMSELVGDAPQLSGLRGGYFEFAVAGLVLTGYAMTCTTAFHEMIREAQSEDTLEVLLATPTSLRTLLAGTLPFPLLLCTVDTAFVLTVATALLGATIDVGGLLIALPLLVLVLGTFAALGILSAAVIVVTKRGDPFSAIAIQASNLLAGALFPVTVLPDALQAVARFVPAFYGLRSIRAVLLADAGLGDVAGDALILVGFNLLLLPLALWAFGRAVRIARVTGTLGNR